MPAPVFFTVYIITQHTIIWRLLSIFDCFSKLSVAASLIQFWWTVSRSHIFIPRHTLVARYYVIPFGVCPSVRPSVLAHHFRLITWVFIYGIFSNFAYILLSAMSGMGLLMGKIHPFLTELLPFFVLEKWFLACYSFTVHDIWMKLHRYVAHQRLHIVTKDRHSDLPSLWVIRPW